MNDRPANDNSNPSNDQSTGPQPPVVWLPAALRALARKIEKRRAP